MIKKINNWLFICFVCFFVLINCIFFIFECISKRVNGHGVDESVFYFISSSSKGADFKSFYFEVFLVILLLILSCFVIFLILKLSNKFKCCVAFLFLFLLPLNDGFLKTLNFYFSSFNKESLSYSDFNVSKDVVIKNKRNLIYIYLESFENKYFNEEIFPGLVANLNNIKSNSFSLSNVFMPYGTGWTIAGMVGSQCGLPLVVSGGNNLGSFDEFLPDNICIGDILKSNGYSNYFYGGADSDFSGKWNFYKSHGFDYIYGLKELGGGVDTKSDWGLFDDDLFNIIKKDFNEIKKKTPYSLFMINVDTHHPKGIQSSFCKDKIYNDGSIGVLNSVYCTDILVSELINYFRSNDPDALIVVSSDHLAMPNDAKEMLEGKDRRNLFFVFGDGVKSEQKTLAVSTFDFGSTVLGFLGADFPSLGWGRDIKNESSLIEKNYNFEIFNKKISSMNNFHSKFISGGWGGDVKFEGKKFKIGTKEVRAPFAINFNNSNEVEKIYVRNSGDNLVSEFARDYKKIKDNFVVVDKCLNFYSLSIRNDYIDGYCSWVSRSRSDEMDFFGFVDEGWSMGADFKFSIEMSEIKINDYLIEMAYGNSSFYEVKKTGFLHKNIEADLNGGFLVESYLKYGGGIFPVKRGISFYKIDFLGKIELIEAKDFCDEKETADISEELASSFKKKIIDYYSIVYVVADSAFCNKELFLKYVDKTPLELKDLSFREPFFGIYSNTINSVFRSNGKNRIVIK